MKRNKYILFLLLIVLFLVACSSSAGGPGAATSPLARVTVPASVSEQADTLATQAAAVAATAAVGATAVAASAETDSVVATAVAQGETVAATAQSAASQIQNDLNEKFSSVQPDENGNVNITITDDELNQAIGAAQAAAAQTGRAIQIQNAQVTFTGGNIVLTGNVTEPVAADLSVTFRPYVAGAILQFEVVSATIGGLAVPPSLLQSAETTLNSTLGEAMNSLPAQVVLQDVIMGEGTMTVVGSRA